MARAEHPDRLSTTVEIYTITGAASVMAVAALSCVGRVGSRVTNISQYTSPWQVQARSSTRTGIADILRMPSTETRKPWHKVSAVGKWGMLRPAADGQASNTTIQR